MSNHSNSPVQALEMMARKYPQLPELVEFWASYLEFWDTDGGLDNTTPEEIEQAHFFARAKAGEILVNFHPKIIMAYSDIALHAARTIRSQSLTAEVGQVHE